MFTLLLPLRRVMFVEFKNTTCKLFNMKIVTWQPVDEAPGAKIQVTVILPFSSTTALEDWRPVVSIYNDRSMINHSKNIACKCSLHHKEA